MDLLSCEIKYILAGNVTYQGVQVQSLLCKMKICKENEVKVMVQMLTLTMNLLNSIANTNNFIFL